MALRVCGATKARTAAEAARCWCGGVFCGAGGAKLSARFFKTFKTTKTAASREAYRDLTMQADLFDGNAVRLEWEGRIALDVVKRARRAS